MFNVTFQEIKNKKWQQTETPPTLTEIIDKLKSLIGKDAVIKVELGHAVTYLYGSNVGYKVLDNAYGQTNTIMSIEHAYTMIQYTPHLFTNIIRKFTDPQTVETYINNIAEAAEIEKHC